MKALEKIVRELFKMLYGLLIGAIVDFIKLMKEFCKSKKKKDQLKKDHQIYTRCQVVPSIFYKRPDPLIYSQDYLMSKGLAVTWDNPDIQLYTIDPVTRRKVLPVSSSDLLLNTDYLIEATVYNGSTEAPAVNMPVDFSFLSFGIGTTSNFIGTTLVDLPVRGAPNHPAHVSAIWHTPNIIGHYCLQVNLKWPDDANPKNNMGQENTNVGVFHSPAVFEFPVKNNTNGEDTITLEADTYTLQQPIDCNQVINGRVFIMDRKTNKPVEGPELCKLLAEQHRQGKFPVPDGWTIDIVPNNFILAPTQQQMVKVTITPPDTFTGTQAFNINGYNKMHQLIGGITLYTQR